MPAALSFSARAISSAQVVGGLVDAGLLEQGLVVEHDQRLMPVGMP